MKYRSGLRRYKASMKYHGVPIGRVKEKSLQFNRTPMGNIDPSALLSILPISLANSIRRRAK